MIDAHCHLAALPTPENGCLLSPKMKNSLLAKLISWQQDLPFDDAEETNRRYLKRLTDELGRSKRVSGAVLLGMDGVYDSNGALNEAKTDFLISNEAVFAACRQTKEVRLLPGVSINPMRKDAVAEVDRCADLGAALVKVLPNAQAFNPAETKHRNFYKALARRKLPLLSHVGWEFSLIGQDQSVGDPDRLLMALEEGVTVIAAHGCSTGLFFIESHLATLNALAARWPNFYTDLSALTLPNRFGALLRLKRMPHLFDRMVFGTDYPLPVFGWGLGEADNRFDKQAQVLDKLGVRVGKELGELLPVRL